MIRMMIKVCIGIAKGAGTNRFASLSGNSIQLERMILERKEVL